MSSQIEAPASASTGVNKTEEGILKRRPGLFKPRSISSPTTFTKSADSGRIRPFPVTITDCEEENGPSEDVSPQSLSTTNTVNSTFSKPNASGSSDLTSNQSPVSEVLPAQKETTGDTNTIRERRPLRTRRYSRPSQRPDSLHLSESESSMVAQDGNRHPSRDTNQFKVRRRGSQISPSTSLSTPSGAHNDIFSERQTESRSDLSWSPEFPEYAIASQPPPGPFSPSFDPRFGAQHPFGPQALAHHHQYGTPETPRGPAPFPFFQVPHATSPMSPAPLMSPQARADRPPLSGYELLAAKLNSEIEGPHVKPIYRRFDAINHRILLSLQDQIVALEETLDEIDATDSANRQEGNIPASEREERDSTHPFHARKGAILGLLSQKLQSYNTLLASFRDIQALPPPTVGDIHDYKVFLDAERPIVEMETRFLSAPDLVVLEPSRRRGAITRNNPAPRQVDKPTGWALAQKAILSRGPRQELVVGMVIATLGPLITFPVIRDFVGRITIAVLFGAVACVILLRSGMINPLASTQDAQDLLVCCGVYVGGMAILSWVLR